MRYPVIFESCKKKAGQTVTNLLSKQKAIVIAIALLLITSAAVAALFQWLNQKVIAQSLQHAKIAAATVRSALSYIPPAQQPEWLTAIASSARLKVIFIAEGDPARVVQSSDPALVGMRITDIPLGPSVPEMQQNHPVGPSYPDFYVDANALRVMGFHSTSTDARSNGGPPLLIGAGADNAAIAGTVRNAFANAMSLLLLILLPGIGLSYWVVRKWWIHPVRAMRTVMQKRATADDKVRVPVKGSSTVRSLARGLNVLLDQWNEERTIASLDNRRLRENEAHARAILDSVRDGIIFCDDTGKILSFNPGAERIFGYQEAEVRDQNLRVLMPAHHSHNHDEYLRRYLSTGQAKIIGIGRELEGRRKDGSEFPLELGVAEVRMDGSRYFTGIVRDITEARRVNERLKESEARAHAILQSVRDGIIFCDARGVIRNFNPGAERIFGYEAIEVVGRNLSKLMPAKYGQEHDDFIHRYIRTGHAKIIGIGRELEGLRKDGTTFPIELAVADVRLGEERFFTGIVRDITERKRAEAALREARDAALAAARAKSEFVATMSHEIRTPMNGVLGMAQVLRHTSLNQDQRQYVDTIVRTGKALLSVLNDILDFSKIEAGRLDLELMEMDIETVLNEIVQLFFQQAAEKNVQLLMHCHADCPRRVMGDPGRLRQILINLVGNAIKFTDVGQILVEATLVERRMNTVCVQISVTDTGIGIAPQSQQKLFAPFTQADASTTRNYGGTGLGLAISRRLVELMGGKIELSSVLGEGSRFSFMIPLGLAPNRVRYAEPSQPGRSVLVTLDNAIQRRAVVDELHHLGVKAHTTPGVSDMVEKMNEVGLENNALAVIICDPDQAETIEQVLTRNSEPGGVKQMPRIFKIAPSSHGSAEAITYIEGSNSWSNLREGLAGVLTSPQERSSSERDVNTSSESQIGPMPRSRVLLVEDVEFNQLVVKLLLEQMGCNAEVAFNGAEAMEKYRTESFDLILMDCRMPVMDGFTATALIRQHERTSHQHLPIIALTANVLESDRQRCLDAGMDDFIAKPIEEDTLRRKLYYWLTQGNRRKDHRRVESLDEQNRERASMDPLFDETRVREFRRLAGNQAGILIQLFVDNLKEKVQEIESAVRSRDADTLHVSAHALKGMCTNIGASHIQRLAQMLDTAALTHELSKVDGLVAELICATGMSEQWIRARVKDQEPVDAVP